MRMKVARCDIKMRLSLRNLSNTGDLNDSHADSMRIGRATMPRPAAQRHKYSENFTVRSGFASLRPSGGNHIPSVGSAVHVHELCPARPVTYRTGTLPSCILRSRTKHLICTRTERLWAQGTSYLVDSSDI